MKTHKQDVKEFLKDPENIRAYESLDVEFMIYSALVRERIQKKLTQKQLADRIGIAQSALARFESGRTNPTLSFLQKITSGLGLRITIV
ncbi:MAG: helix-turn-helix transcriptional regulator [Candidatus Taylorbacteria bacterium]